MKILFAPDYREGIPYQQLLSEQLQELGFEVEYLRHTRRIFPLYRGRSDFEIDALHLHWPEIYFPRKRDGWDWFRKQRYPTDLSMATQNIPLFLTAHNLLPHNRREEPGVFRNVQYTAQAAQAVFVHSEAALKMMVETFSIPAEKCHIIPYGDHSVTTGAPLDKRDARNKLQLDPEETISLIFGTVSPYKGSDEIVQWWKDHHEFGKLIVAGPVLSEEYAAQLHQIAQGAENIELRISEKWLSDEDLHEWLSAVDCSIFNYKEIFTSGAAALARSFGVPLLIPSRLTAADLAEPHSHVFRFENLETDFADRLREALATPVDYEAAGAWREATSWSEVAAKTAAVYRSVFDSR